MMFFYASHNVFATLKGILCSSTPITRSKQVKLTPCYHKKTLLNKIHCLYAFLNIDYNLCITSQNNVYELIGLDGLVFKNRNNP